MNPTVRAYVITTLIVLVGETLHAARHIVWQDGLSVAGFALTACLSVWAAYILWEQGE